MSSTILVVGATGNTGKGVMLALPNLLKLNKDSYRILGLTRSLKSPSSKKLSELPGVEMEEKDWTTVEPAWLRERNVVRVFIAPHNEPQQFAEESGFYLALLAAEVKYVVRISTLVEWLKPASPIYYGRAHWAVENLLSQPEFRSLQYTSLRPNFYASTFLAFATGWIKEYQRTGKQTNLVMSLAEDVSVAVVDPEDVGTVGAHLLALEDTSAHSGKRYTISGPVDVTGRDLVELVGKIADVKVENADFKFTSFLDQMIEAGMLPAKLRTSLLSGFDTMWDGTSSLKGLPTSPEVLALLPKQRTPEIVIRASLEQ